MPSNGDGGWKVVKGATRRSGLFGSSSGRSPPRRAPCRAPAQPSGSPLPDDPRTQAAAWRLGPVQILSSGAASAPLGRCGHTVARPNRDLACAPRVRPAPLRERVRKRVRSWPAHSGADQAQAGSNVQLQVVGLERSAYDLVYAGSLFGRSQVRTCRNSLSGVMALSVAALAALGGPSTSNGAEPVEAAQPYRCVPAVAQAIPAPPTPGADPVAVDVPPARCPAGRVPFPLAGIGSASPGRHHVLPAPARPNGSGAPPATNSGDFEYGLADRYVNTGTATSANVSIHNPALDPRDSHTLAEISAADNPNGPGVYDTAELGWTVDPPDFGDSRTHLFVYSGLAAYSNPVCYPGNTAGQGSCGWTQVSPSIKPGDVLPTASGSHQTFQLIRNSRGWEMYYGFYDLGYYSNAWYALSGESFPSASRFEWYGEVAHNNNYLSTCTDMGDGLPSTNVFAAYINNISFTSAYQNYFDGYPSPTLNPYYNVTLGTDNQSMRYGGTGRC